MRKVLILTVFAILGVGAAGAASRDANSVSRTGGNTLASASVNARTTANSGRGINNTVSRTATNIAPRSTNARTETNTTARNSGAIVSRNGAATARATAATGRGTTPARTSTTAHRGTSAIVSRAAATPVSAAETRTGADYERCKTAYFTCMDQFCSLKNDDYRRCSCSNRVTQLTEMRDVLQQAGQKLTIFTENLDVVGMTAAQAAAMRTASEGENALTSDTSASKALLQAIMNSIRGQDTNVGGKYSDLNSISISFDTSNAFGITDSAQVIASYNGQNLYNAVYPQCRDAVRDDCNNASLQRAITAYLMAVEQDCNTVQTAIAETQKQMKAAVREGSAMLDLARVENRQKHNSDDIATCLANVESAILSEEVCGANYHKCLDNGEFIDVSTGAPITGVVNFYKLEKLLTFSTGVAAADQRLSKSSNNRMFVQNFENRTKKFAEPALNKCTENADVVWDEYLDKAMLDIYYAQRSKVAEIKQGCFDFVSTCYMNGDTAMTAAMRELIGDPAVLLQPDKVALSTQLCRDYVEACNNMFSEEFNKDIVAQYVENRQDTDTMTACRAVAQQCFDKFGGTNYENFYYPYSGLFTRKNAPDWFTLYETQNGEPVLGSDGKPRLVSECAKQLAAIDACNTTKILETAFGGLDYTMGYQGYANASRNDLVYYTMGGTDGPVKLYGQTDDELRYPDMIDADGQSVSGARIFANRRLRPTGVATEVYNQIVDILSTQCINLTGRFVESQFVKINQYNPDNICKSAFNADDNNPYAKLTGVYGIQQNEDMCPRDYVLNVDTGSWGACLCWENGARRSKNGKSAACVAELPVNDAKYDAYCDNDTIWDGTGAAPVENWCTPVITTQQQVCPLGAKESSVTGLCEFTDGSTDPSLSGIPEAIR